MKRKRYSEEQIISILKENEAGVSVRDLVRKYGVSEQSIYRWRKEYGGLRVDQAKRPHSALGYRPPAPEVVIPNEMNGKMETSQMAA